MTILSIDVETYSPVELKKCGTYRYVESSEFEILLLAYAFEDDPVEIVDLANLEPIPDEVWAAFFNPDVTIRAFNAAFERATINRHFDLSLPADKFFCTMAHGLTLGLPIDLKRVGQVLNLSTQKDGAGTALINYFSKPCKPTKANGGRTRNMPWHNPDKWEKYKSYCCDDVETERLAANKMTRFPMHPVERKTWLLDQKINDFGVYVDTQLAENALAAHGLYLNALRKEAKTLSGLDNPGAVPQLKSWLSEQFGEEIKSLTADDVPIYINRAKAEGNDPAVKMLQFRQEDAKTSIAKYDAMLRTRCRDGRSHGLTQYYVAHTGRWGGRFIQLQNLPRNVMKTLDEARYFVREAHFEMVDLFYDSLPDTLSQLIRTALVPAPGNKFIVVDFSAIEARVIAWLANERGRLEVFASHGMIYEASASSMFGVPIDKVDKELRQRGKVAELALGFQGAVGSLISMGALDKGLSEEELPDLVERWRAANPNIVQLWKDIEKAAIKAVRQKTTVTFHHGITFEYKAGLLFMYLPSGRYMAYVQPEMVDGKFGRKQLSYMGTNDKGQWVRLPIYGGRLVENAVQAIARDCLRDKMLDADKQGAHIAFHVHDEIVCEEAKDGDKSLDTLLDLMRVPIPWAPGLPLDAAGFESDYYLKD